MKNTTPTEKLIVAVIVIITIAMVGLTFNGCSRPKTAMRVLADQGYTHIEITGWRPFMKSQNDWYSTGFKATSPSGKTVTGAVTGGLFKGNTIRFD